MPTYPVPVELSDVAAEALGGTTDPGSRVALPAWGSTSKAAIARMIKRLADWGVPAIAGMVVDEGGLNVGAFPCEYSLGGTAYQFTGQTGFALTDAATNYVYLDATATLVKSTVSFPGTEAHVLAIVTTSGGDITAVRDVRGRNFGRGSGASWSAFAAAGAVDLDGFDVLNLDELHLADAATEPTAAGRLRRKGAQLLFDDGTAVRQLLTTAAAITVAQGGTGAATLADRGVLVGRGTGAVEVTAAGTAGHPLLGAGAGANPAFGQLDLAGAGKTGILPAANGGTGTSETQGVPWSAVLQLPGTAAVAVLTDAIYVPLGVTIIGAALAMNTAPTGQPAIMDVRDDGVSLWSGVQANMPQCAAGATSGLAAAIAVAVAAGSWLTVEWEQVGSGTPGANATLTLWGWQGHRT